MVVEDSPVIQALKEDPNIDLVSCRRCGKKGHQMEWRWFRWGANGYCSKKCSEKAKEEYQSKQKVRK